MHLIAISVALVILLVMVGGGYWYWKYSHQDKEFEEFQSILEVEQKSSSPDVNRLAKLMYFATKFLRKPELDKTFSSVVSKLLTTRMKLLSQADQDSAMKSAFWLFTSAEQDLQALFVLDKINPLSSNGLTFPKDAKILSQFVVLLETPNVAKAVQDTTGLKTDDIGKFITYFKKELDAMELEALQTDMVKISLMTSSEFEKTLTAEKCASLLVRRAKFKRSDFNRGRTDFADIYRALPLATRVATKAIVLKTLPTIDKKYHLALFAFILDDNDKGDLRLLLDFVVPPENLPYVILDGHALSAQERDKLVAELNRGLQKQNK